MQIQVTYAGNKFGLPEIGPADFVAFERQFKVSASALSDESALRFEWLCFLAFRGLRKDGNLNPEDSVKGYTDEFIERIDALEIVTDEAEESDDADPSVPAAQHG